MDPERSQRKDYVRVKVRFDVSKPVRRSKIVNLPKGGGTATILYDFERIQKWCYSCQRLTHEKEKCPLVIDARLEKGKRKPLNLPRAGKIIKEDDPLFGVIEEHQVGLNPATGRQRIAKEVLDGMRQSLGI